MRGRVVMSMLVEGASTDIVGCEVGEPFHFVSEHLANEHEAWRGFVCRRRYLPTKAVSRLRR
jgi:hypothetical protein